MFEMISRGSEEKCDQGGGANTPPAAKATDEGRALENLWQVEHQQGEKLRKETKMCSAVASLPPITLTTIPCAPHFCPVERLGLRKTSVHNS